MTQQLESMAPAAAAFCPSDSGDPSDCGESEKAMNPEREPAAGGLCGPDECMEECETTDVSCGGSTCDDDATCEMEDASPMPCADECCG